MAAILTDDSFKCIFLNENVRIPIQISLKFASMSPIINNKPALVPVMALRLTGDQCWPSSLMRICGTKVDELSLRITVSGM